MVTRPRAHADPRADALKHLTRLSGGIDDACVAATRVHREDASREDREKGVGLCLRRAERLAGDLIASIQRVPK